MALIKIFRLRGRGKKKKKKKTASGFEWMEKEVQTKCMKECKIAAIN